MGLSALEKIEKDIINAIDQKMSSGTTPYDTEARVIRIDGDTAWVHIPGGVNETPVKMTVNAQQGDTVQIRVGGGKAWIVGNETAPPTDDAKANEADAKAVVAKEEAGIAKETADNAKTTADKTAQYFWADEDGAHVTQVSQNEWNDSTGESYQSGGNTLITSEGVSIRDGLTDLAIFGETSRIGEADLSRVEISPGNFSVFSDETTALNVSSSGGTMYLWKTFTTSSLLSWLSVSTVSNDFSADLSQVSSGRGVRVRLRMQCRFFRYQNGSKKSAGIPVFYSDWVTFTKGTSATKSVAVKLASSSTSTATSSNDAFTSVTFSIAYDGANQFTLSKPIAQAYPIEATTPSSGFSGFVIWNARPMIYMGGEIEQDAPQIDMYGEVNVNDVPLAEHVINEIGIGTIIEKKGGTDWTSNLATGSTGTEKNIASISIPKGTWIVTVRCSWTPSSSGNHWSKIIFSTTSGNTGVHDRKFMNSDTAIYHNITYVIDQTNDEAQTFYVTGAVGGQTGNWNRTTSAALMIRAVRIL